MLVEATQRKEIEEINKQQKRLEGEGDKLRLEGQAKGNAAKILEDLKAEAEGKEKLQEAVGVAGAKALENADIKVFSGGSDGDKAAFDVGKALEGLSVANEGSLKSVLNRMARPYDLGFKELPVGNKSGEQEKNREKEEKGVNK